VKLKLFTSLFILNKIMKHHCLKVFEEEIAEDRFLDLIFRQILSAVFEHTHSKHLGYSCNQMLESKFELRYHPFFVMISFISLFNLLKCFASQMCFA